MLRSADWFLGRFNSKEHINLLYLSNNHNNSVHGQMFNKIDKEAAPIMVLIAEVQITISESVCNLRNLIKGKVLVRITRIRAKD
jgi:hypothetical protein